MTMVIRLPGLASRSLVGLLARLNLPLTPRHSHNGECLWTS